MDFKQLLGINICNPRILAIKKVEKGAKSFISLHDHKKLFAIQFFPSERRVRDRFLNKKLFSSVLQGIERSIRSKKKKPVSPFPKVKT
jgi:hypothetical protein